MEEQQSEVKVWDFHEELIRIRDYSWYFDDDGNYYPENYDNLSDWFPDYYKGFVECVWEFCRWSFFSVPLIWMKLKQRKCTYWELVEFNFRLYLTEFVFVNRTLAFWISVTNLLSFLKRRSWISSELVRRIEDNYHLGVSFLDDINLDEVERYRQELVELISNNIQEQQNTKR